MSYILDALRRADAERARAQGTVPDPGHPALALPITLAPSPRPRWPLLVGAGLAGGVVVGALAWWGGAWRGTPPAAGATDRATTAVAAHPAGSVGSVTEAAPAPAPAPASDRRAGAATGATAPARESGRAVTAEPGLEPARTQPRERAPSLAAASAPAPALTRLADLPPALRQRLMALQPGGVVHAASRSQRLVLINGQVFHEGEQPQPGLVLEQIRLKSLVFSLDGYRFEWPL